MASKKIIIPLNSDSEADTCRKEVTPKLYASEWTDDQILEQRTFTDGKIVILGKIAKRQKPKKADYILRIGQNFPIAVIEAKKKYKTASAGLQQAKDYAETLDCRFAYATNGAEIVEYDFITGLETAIAQYPTPQELWNRYLAAQPMQDNTQEILLKPMNPNSGKAPRYYQEIAINRAIQAILEGKQRLLLTLATGTGKTSVAFQIIYKLWNNRWNIDGEHRRPKVLFLADRKILVDDPYSKDFAVFGDARASIVDDGATTSRETNENAWRIPAAEILQYDAGGKLLSANLDRKNPTRRNETEYAEPSEAIAAILEKEREILALMEDIQKLIKA